MSSYFYSKVDSSVQSELTRRSEYIGGSKGGFRSSKAHAFTIEKGVYGYIKSTYTSPTGNSQDVYLGFDRGPQDGFDTLYRPNKRFTPRPVLTSINVGSEGTYGSLRKIDIKFTVFDKSDVDLYTDIFLLPRKGVTVGWGWSNYGDFGGNSKQNRVSVEGNVFNFGYAVNEIGAYECYFSLYTKGFFSLGILTNQAGNTRSTVPVGEGEESPVYSGLIGRLESDIKNFQENIVENNGLIKKATSNSGEEFYYGFLRRTNDISKANNFLTQPSDADKGQGCVMFSFRSLDNTDETTTTTEESNSEDTADKAPFTYYVNLQYVVDILINTCIIKAQTKSDLVLYRTNYIVSQTNYDSKLFSADPDTIIFPDNNMSTYTTRETQQTYSVTYFPMILDNKRTGISYAASAALPAGKADMSKILINVEFIKELLTDLKSDAAIPAFLNDIFDRIYRASGEIVKPTLVDASLVSDTENAPFIDVVDTNKAHESGISPYNFKAFANNSLIKTINLNTELSSKIATQFYLSANANLNNADKAIGNILLGKSNASKEGIAASEEEKKLEQKNTAEDVATTSHTPDVQSKSIQYGAPELGPKKKLEQAKSQYATYGATPEVMATGRSALRHYAYKDKGSHKHTWNQAYLIPIKLSLTIDGISGLKYGNIITTDWLPTRYYDSNKDSKIVFCITNISHEITNGGWETNIETQCRLNLSKAIL